MITATVTRRPGRPTVGDATIKAIVPTELVAAVDRAAAAEGQTRSEFVRDALTGAATAPGAIYAQIYGLQLDAYRTAMADRDDYYPPVPQNQIDPDDATKDADCIALNNLDLDWGVEVMADDLVRVWAAGDVEAEAIILGATTWAQGLLGSDD